MENELYKYLERFMHQNNWLDEHVSEQARSIFTTICLTKSIESDTAPAGIMLMNLYDSSEIGTLDVSYEEFENFMYELIV